MRRARGTAGLLRRRSRADLTSLLAMAVLVLVTATLAALVPRVLAATADQAVRDALDSAQQEQLEVSASSTNDEAVDQLDRVDRQIRRGLSEDLRRLVGDGGRGATTGLYDTLDLAGEPSRPKPFAWLQLRHQPGVLEEVRWVAGRAPRPPAPGRTTVETEGETVPLLEVALHRSVARQLDLRAGQTVVLEPLETPPVGDGTVAVRIVGLFMPLEPAAALWTYGPFVTSPGAEYSGSGELTAEYGTALVDETQLAALSAASPVLRYDWHYPVAVEEVDSANAGAVLADLRATVARGAFVPSDNSAVTGGADSVSVASGLVALLEAYVERADAAESLVALVLTGMLAVGLAVLCLAGLVVAGRRAAGAALLRARGASRLAVSLVSVVEVACFALPAAALGWWLASELVAGGRGAVPAAAAALLVTAVSLGVVGVVTWREGGPPRSSRLSRRVVLEAVVGVVAVLGVLEIRRSGVGEDGADPVLALVPVLVVVAVALVALRLLPAVLRWTSRRSAPGAGLLPFLGLARAARQPLAVAVPLSTLLLGLGFAVFAAGVTSTINDGQRASAWQEVGADFRLDAEFFEEQDIAAVEGVAGVEAVVPALRREQAKIYDPAGRATYGSALVVDAAAYADLLATEPDAGVDVETLRDLAADVEDDEPLPAVASTGAAEALGAETGTIDPTASLGLTDVRVIGSPQAFPLDDGAESVVLDLPAVQDRESFPIRPNTLLVQAPGSSQGDLEAVFERFPQEVTVADRRATLEELRGSPFVGSTQAMFAVGTLTAAVYCALALALVLVLNARPRARLAGTLRMLGAPARQVGRLAVLEIAPLVLVMVAAGAAAGVLLTQVLLPGVDLLPLTGGLAAPDPVVGLTVTAALSVGLLILVSLTVLVLSAVEGRRRVGETLRGGEET